MKTNAWKAWDLMRLIRHGGPGLCNIAVTNSCNAACAFCNFARDKHHVTEPRWIDADKFGSALDILFGRDIRYLSFFGGEPLLHPRTAEMIGMAIERGMTPSLITNGWLLAAQLGNLAAAGLKVVFISIDAPSIINHEENRGLKGLGARIRTATERMSSLGMTALASVTMNKLIDDYDALVPLLRDLGFAAVTFSYPQQATHGSSSLVWSDDSELVDFTPDELVAAFDSVDRVRRSFPVTNPRASVEDMKRHVRGEPERFACYAGYKSFYMDWNFDVWRCETLNHRLCSVWDFAQAPFVRDGCTACIADCYRDSSVMLHMLVSLGDAIDALADRHVLAALKTLASAPNLTSLGAVAGNVGLLSRVAALR